MSDPAVSRERAFVSTEAEKIEHAARRLRSATFLAPGHERSEIVSEVADALAGVADRLRQKA